MSAAPDGDLRPYVPRALLDWDRHGGAPIRLVEGSLVSADISGFTKISERLAGLGRHGAEELTDLLNHCFDGMIAICDLGGGDVLKFGGDALLVLFTGPQHAQRACDAAIDMRESIARPLTTTSGQSVKLGMSVGVHSGVFTLFVVDVGHRELFVTGPAATRTVMCEGEAKSGQILVTDETAGLLHPSLLGARHPEGRLLRRSLRPHGGIEADDPEVHQHGREREAVDVMAFVPTAQ